MLRKLWLTFAQTATICVAALFIIGTFRPEWLPGRPLSLSRTDNSAGIAISEAPVQAGAPAIAPGSYAGAAKRAMPAVVNIYTTKAVSVARNPFGDDPVFRHFFGDRFGTEKQQVNSLGSGVIVSTEGFVLTNHHVVDSADEIEVALSDGRKAAAKLVGSDPETDLAVLKINLPNVAAITFAQLDRVQVGDPVLAIGNPFGVGQTVTQGIVSALGRNHLGINTFENFIQTDAAINPGNSGGALIDANGNLLGINTAIYSRSGGSMGIGFAIPVTTAKQVLEAIVKSGSVTRGYIGVEPQDITAELASALKLAKSSGTLITGVMRGGPADRAGMLPGDIIVNIGDQPVPNTSAMLNLIAQLQPGAAAKIKVLRGAKELELPVVVAKRPPPPPRKQNER